MDPQPEILTERLILRPLTRADGRDVQRLAGDWDVAFTTQNIPHPYPEGVAEQWIEATLAQYARGESVTFAITLVSTKELVGSISVVLRREMENAELGYWIGKPYWNRGYASEAARAILDYAFRTFKLNRIYARHMSRNPASGRVMRKIGMQHEGRLRQHMKKWGMFEDIDFYGILRDEFFQGK